MKTFFFIKLLIKTFSQRFLLKQLKTFAKNVFFIKLYVKKRFATFFNCFNKKNVAKRFLFINSVNWFSKSQNRYRNRSYRN
jgi:hypothetical protein